MTTTSPLTVREAAESRRAIRKYLQQPVPEADVREIIRQVSLAPSPNNIQPWRFVVVRGPALKKQLEPAVLNQRQVLSTHCLIVLYADMEDVLATSAEIVHPGITGDARVRALATQRTAEGYLAEVVGEDNDLLLIEHHCPICVAASTCQSLCRSELEVFQTALGPTAKVTRMQHLLGGDTRCTYRISSVQQPN